MFLEAEGCDHAADRCRSAEEEKEEEEKAAMNSSKEKQTDAHELRLQF